MQRECQAIIISGEPLPIKSFTPSGDIHKRPAESTRRDGTVVLDPNPPLAFHTRLVDHRGPESAPSRETATALISVWPAGAFAPGSAGQAARAERRFRQEPCSDEVREGLRRGGDLARVRRHGVGGGEGGGRSRPRVLSGRCGLPVHQRLQQVKGLGIHIRELDPVHVPAFSGLLVHPVTGIHDLAGGGDFTARGLQPQV